ncbi:Metallo-dependent phosphatase [Mycena indigotica]|uniref:Metallo-dependent phosphatase n=1 Tax=Mycena indigotica TaxID=2126181 RepID=A0A8H6TC32_9AGAR|nr:Metallo-dependent phosphatase [Mycena indigotica]KAF7314948.1 Metallo-dependent phosphatase [Mycena indigotica]
MRLLSFALSWAAVLAGTITLSPSPPGYPPPGHGSALNLTIFHVNDIHAHLDEITTSGTDCTNPAKGCYGGYARIKAAVDAGRKSVKNSLFLNMGDEFQGTLFFSYYGGEVIADTLNQLNFDAMTLGNHEFDRGDTYLGQFLANLTVPIVCANVDSANPTINTTVKPYHVFPQYKLAVIAVTTDTIPTTSNPDKSTTFSDPTDTIQHWTNYVYAHEHVERVIVMTHIGYDVDLELAKNTRGVHLVIGGHSHTLLGNMAGAAGPYPTVVQNLDGEDVYILQAYRYGEYLGYIDIEFAPGGRVASWTGGPIHLTNTSVQDTSLQSQIKAWRAPFDAFGNQVVGSTSILLNHNGCKTGECNFGDLICDVMMDYRKNQSAPAGCILNGGGIRVDIPVGDITRGDVINAFPFGNAVTDVRLTGQAIWDIFAGAVSGTSLTNGAAVVTWPQIAGFTVTYDPTTKKLLSLEIGGATIDLAATYTIVTSDYAAGGGDNIIPAQTGFAVLDTLDEVLTAYILRVGTVNEDVQGRVVLVPS